MKSYIKLGLADAVFLYKKFNNQLGGFSFPVITILVKLRALKLLRVTCNFFFVLFFFLVKLVDLIGGGSVIKGAYTV